ncbi:hypothetical protein A5740_19230 [Mycobacterium sp. GA-1841]|uniref:hypothetical protein n=1 Tax=Mycobacterium sp. GA-1841 TaxID=1834154 RepID=UPI00096F1590|nr:hypothetical protein [Mycobacterium sp. GA-1841]OMC28973.1 hypothetical protein A5740_19230 [Mycobacterium sp. GA-1841]
MSSAIAKKLARQLNDKAANTKPQDEPTDPLAVAFLRKLEERGLGKYLSDDEPDPAEARREAMRELAQWNRDYQSGKYDEERQAKREAEAEAERQQGMSAGEIFIEAIRKANDKPTGGPPPLNGAGIMRAAVRGLGGRVTVNGSSL